MKYDNLEKLNRLKESGAISEEEYQIEKEKILNAPDEPVYDTKRELGVDENTFCVLLHISNFFFLFLGPLVMWLIGRDKSAFIDSHGKSALNWSISATIYGVVSSFLTVVFIGIPMLFALVICSLIFTIIAAIRASEGKMYKYPLSITLIK